MDQRLATEWVRDNIAQFGGMYQKFEFVCWLENEDIIDVPPGRGP
jgi:hypothetical protein